MQTVSTITCPQCEAATTETMPSNACWFFYECPHCQKRLKPLAGDCCVFCSYGDVPCPPIQEARATPACEPLTWFTTAKPASGKDTASDFNENKCKRQEPRYYKRRLPNGPI